jgi:hypothetical protein
MDRYACTARRELEKLAGNWEKKDDMEEIGLETGTYILQRDLGTLEENLK